MATVTTAQTVNLYQLGQELGVPVSWRMVGPRPDGTRTISTDDVDQASLDAAIASHAADPNIRADEPDPPVVLTDSERLTALLAALASAQTIDDVQAAAAAAGGQ